MSYGTIQMRSVTPRLGAEISNIDLTATLSNQQVENLRTALAEHQILFFRDQKINLEQQKTLGRHFGDLDIHPNTPGPDGHPTILLIHADKNTSGRMAKTGTPTPPAIRSRRWAVSSTSTPFRRRVAIRSLPASRHI
jgi:alpha-ketoglutarate-dependent taurine dioxygenase